MGDGPWSVLRVFQARRAWIWVPASMTPCAFSGTGRLEHPSVAKSARASSTLENATLPALSPSALRVAVALCCAENALIVNGDPSRTREPDLRWRSHVYGAWSLTASIKVHDSFSQNVLPKSDTGGIHTCVPCVPTFEFAPSMF
jgi:hypothetical protein